MKRRSALPVPLALLAMAVSVLLPLLPLLRPARVPAPPPDVAGAGRPPRTIPDYSGACLPANLSPPDLTVAEPGSAYYVTITPSGGRGFGVGSYSRRLAIPLRAWRTALQGLGGRPGSLSFEISVRDGAGRWTRFSPVTCTIGEPVDRYLAYRVIGPVYSIYNNVSLRQRDLQTGRNRLVLDGHPIAWGCVNCHTFHNGRADRMTFGVRSSQYGNSALVVSDGKAMTVDATWGYNSWHPSGQAVAYSLNKVRQFFHDSTEEVRDVVDLDSDVVVWHADTGTVDTAPALADPNRLETYPCWSPDGRYLYYCSAPITWRDRDTVPPVGYQNIRYDLCRVPYEAASRRFGAPETVLSAAAAGGSLLLPRVSPDGRWLLFCKCQYGCFPVYQPSSDLYLMDLRTRAYRRLEINSPRSESWHSWSANSRWIAFSSKRNDGVFTRLYLAHVDAQGRVSPPVPMPGQLTCADGYLKTHSVPELSTEPVPVGPRALAAAARSSRKVKLQMPEISMTKKKAAPSASEPWQGGRPK